MVEITLNFFMWFFICWDHLVCNRFCFLRLSIVYARETFGLEKVKETEKEKEKKKMVNTSKRQCVCY